MDKSVEFFKAAMPRPTKEQRCIQVGVHIEEFAEMLSALGWRVYAKKIHELADKYKQCWPCCMESIENVNIEELSDSIFDQAVTGKGVAYTNGWDYAGGLNEVEDSNLSKLEGGKAVFDESGKIGKGEHYRRPNLLPHL